MGLHRCVHGIKNTQCQTEDFLQTRRRLTHLFHSHPAAHSAWEFIFVLYNTEGISNICFSQWLRFFYLCFFPPSEPLTERPNSPVVACNISIKLLGSGCCQLTCDGLPENRLFLEHGKFSSSRTTSHVLHNVLSSGLLFIFLTCHH